MRQYIWNIEDCDNEYLKSDREVASSVEISNEERVEIVYNRLDKARIELDIEVQGVIVCFAIMGLWHGSVPGSSVYGSKVSSILYSSYEPCWFGEDGDIRGIMIHHDGTNRVLYRIQIWRRRKSWRMLLPMRVYPKMRSRRRLFLFTLLLLRY